MFLILLTTIPLPVNGISVEKELRSKLLTNYDRWTRPVDNYNEVTNVTYDLSIYQVVEFDAKAETLSTLVWPTACWNDTFISWVPEEYDGIRLIRMSSKEIWNPDILPYNDVGKWYTRKYKDLVPATVHYDGQVCLRIPLLLETLCTMDVRNFPFDEQSCYILLGSWQYRYKEVRTLCASKNLDEKSFSTGSQWQLKQFTCEEREQVYHDQQGYSYIKATVALRRMSKFYVLNLMMPTGILLALSSLIFFLPSRLTDRICFGITCTLALCVNLVVVIDFIPETSRTTPYLCTYFLVSICLSGFAIILSVIVLNLTQCEAENHNLCLRKRSTDYLDLEVQNDENKKMVEESHSRREHKCCLPEERACCTIKNIGRIIGVVYFFTTSLYTCSFLLNWNAPSF